MVDQKIVFLLIKSEWKQVEKTEYYFFLE